MSPFYTEWQWPTSQVVISTSSTANWWHAPGYWWDAPAAREVATPPLTGLKLARWHLSLLARHTALEPDRPAAGPPAPSWRPWASVREHRLRAGSRRRSR